MKVLNINQSWQYWKQLPHRNQPQESVNYFHMKNTPYVFFNTPE